MIDLILRRFCKLALLYANRTSNNDQIILLSYLLTASDIHHLHSLMQVKSFIWDTNRPTPAYEIYYLG